MGNLYKRGGTFYADYFDRDGIRRRESCRTKDPQVARARLRDLELQTTDRGTHSTQALSDALDYFTEVACAGKSAGTVRCYQQKARHVGRLIGDLQLDKMRREDVERYIATRLTEKSHTHSVHKELVVLRGTLKTAKARGLFHGSLEVVPEFDAGYVPRTSYLTPDEFILLVDHLILPAGPKASEKTLAKFRLMKQRRALYCMLVAYASPRRGELEALDWKHVDLERGQIRIPKGKTFGRPIGIHPMLRPWLEALVEDSGPVAGPWSNVVRDLKSAAKRAGLKKQVTPNDLRRTFASWLVQSGVSLYVVSRLLGHTSTRMVELVYGQLDDATLTAAIGKLPGCDAGVSYGMPLSGTTGTTGHTPSAPAIVNSVEESFTSTEKKVPGDGVEPPTRGFSVLRDLAPKRLVSRRLLKAV